MVSAKGFAATALKKAAHENMGCWLLQAGGEALMRQSGLVIGRSVFVMETKHKLVIGAPIAARNESVQVRDTAEQVDFTAEIRRCVELFLSLPHTGSPDSGGEVWYRIPCDTMYLRNQVTGVDYKIRHVACVVWCEWTEEPMVQRTVTYSDLLNNSVIATATTIDLPDVGTLTISVPSSAPLKPVVAETQRRKSAKRA